MQAAEKIIIRDDPLWLPPALRDRQKALVVKFRVSEAERLVYRKKKRIPVSRWAEKYRVVTRGPLEGTRWQNRTTPYLAGIMDASFFPSVEEIYTCSPPQVGKSAAADTCIGWVADRDPGPVLYVYPDEDTANENMRDRILPMFRLSSQLRRYFTGAGDDETAKKINLKHMQIYMAWARSAIKLGNKSIRYGVADEIDKYPETANKREASPLDLLRARLTTFRYSRKLWVVSTPTIESGPIWVLLTSEAQAVFDFWVRCPVCRAYQVMEFKSIKWPEGERDPERVVSEDLARYECPECKSRWDDYTRDLAVRRGQWRERKTGQKLFAYLRDHRPRKIGFHLRSWLSPFVGLSEVAAAFLKGQTSKNKLKDFLNKHCAEPWKDYTTERKEERILALRDERPLGLVPSGGIISCLTAGADTQKYGFWYEIRAWGWGMILESWQVRFGYVDSFEALAQMLVEDEYYDIDGNRYRVRLAVQDAMGERTSEVYDFSRMHRNLVVPFKGERKLASPTTWSKIDVYPGTTKAIPGGIRLLRADVTLFKNQLAGKLEIAPGDPGAWHLTSEANEEYARQMCAEYVNDETGFWECPPGRANHLWDCGVYNLVAADVLGVRFWKRPAEKKPAAQRSEEEKKRGGRWLEKGYRPGWLNR